MPLSEAQKQQFVALLQTKGWQFHDGTIWSASTPSQTKTPAPTGRNISAQGNALGKRMKKTFPLPATEWGEGQGEGLPCSQPSNALQPLATIPQTCSHKLMNPVQTICNLVGILSC